MEYEKTSLSSICKVGSNGNLGAYFATPSMEKRPALMESLISLQNRLPTKSINAIN
jgi:hypothetical protein